MAERTKIILTNIPVRMQTRPSHKLLYARQGDGWSVELVTAPDCRAAGASIVEARERLFELLPKFLDGATAADIDVQEIANEKRPELVFFGDPGRDGRYACEYDRDAIRLGVRVHVSLGGHGHPTQFSSQAF